MSPPPIASTTPFLPEHIASAYGSRIPITKGATPVSDSALLYRNIHAPPRHVVASEGSFLMLSDGTKLLDASCGAAVACLGHNNKRIKEAINRQIDIVSYCLSTTFGTEATEDLANELILGTGGLMKKAYIVCSGKLYHLLALLAYSDLAL
jgi:4-aminobutyrate aminotransferase-like enzyme